MSEKYRVIGVMSGTSLDGLDIAYCEFNHDKKWQYEIILAETINYSAERKQKLSNAINNTGSELSALDTEYGNYIGTCVKTFCEKNNITPDFISSHGHTVFHQPHNGFTKQIGCGADISAVAEKTVVCDFRSSDVALKGLGAPLVPVGDKFLFSDFEYCLNLGGIANISYDADQSRKAFDICACNIVLNHLSERKKLPFDLSGKLAYQGKIQTDLLKKFNTVSYYKKPSPKTLGREEIEKEIFPLLENNFTVEDLLATFCEHIAIQITEATVKGNGKSKMLVSGGGVYNNFLMERIKHHSRTTVIIPDKKTIEFKEALIFAFLGVLRMRNEINCLKSVTGATDNSCSGAVYLFKKRLAN